MSHDLVIGTRGSRLALWQAEWVKAEIERLAPTTTVRLEIIKTKGDKILDVPLAKVGGKGLFVKEIEEALLDGRVDLAVHSMKDMPAEIPPGLAIGAVPRREDPRDAVVSRGNLALRDLPRNARVGTSSLRRAAQIRAVRPDVEITSLRGNLDTRLSKLDSGEMDAIILAMAGLKRMGFADRVAEAISPEVLLPAVGQGALCIEIRANDPLASDLADRMNDPATRTVVLAERAFLLRLEGGCQVPIAAHGTLDGDRLSLVGLVASLDGATIIRDRISGPADEAESLGRRLGDALLDQGARSILASLTGTC